MDQALDSDHQPGYQPGGEAWDPERADIVDLLREAQHVRSYPIYHGSNHTFLVTVEVAHAGQSLAIYKPARGEYPLYDFPSGTLYRREIAAWLLDRLLGWSVVPPTVVSKGQYGVGSLQLYVESLPQAEVEISQLRRIALLDALLNNADRKADHCLPAVDGKLWGIDHGLTFHVQPKLRTVLWHFAGSRLSGVERTDVACAVKLLQKGGRPEVDEMRELIAPAEWRALIARMERLLDTDHFPNPRYKPVPYRW